MNIILDFIPLGRRNRPAGRNGLNFITIHNTGNTNRGANARAHASFLRGNDAANAPVSWHYTVDDVEVFQHLPDAETAFHAGDGNGPGNTQSIGIEICENSDGNLLQATNNAVKLTAALCKKHGIPIENIVQHNRWSGKDCPSRLRRNQPYSWTEFLNRVRAEGSISPEEATIINAIADGIITSKDHWLGVLRGTIAPNPAFIKIMMDNAHRKIRGL